MRFSVLSLAAFFLMTGLPAFAQTHPGSTRAEKLSDGYALLFDLADEEKNADGIFLFKTAEEPTKEVIRRMAELYKGIGHTIHAWAKADKSIDLDLGHLPAMEIEARKGISGQHTKELFTAKTPAFDKLYLTVQWQSLYYAQNLAKALERTEPLADRRRALAQWVQELDQLRVEVSEMIPLPTDE